MKQRVCVPWAQSEDGLPTEYSIYGSPLDVDALLKKARPRGQLRVWRQGDAAEFGPATTSGIAVPVFEGTSTKALFRAVKGFLVRERAFLKAATRLSGPAVQQGLNTTVFVRSGHVPVGLELPASLMSLAAERCVPWSIMCIPCTKDGDVAV